MKALVKKNGMPTEYGYACGYGANESNETTGASKRLYQEHGVYHVQFRTGGYTSPFQWVSFVGLKEAEKFYKSIKILK